MITFYKPNSSNKGALLSVNHTARADKKNEDGSVQKGDKTVWLNFVKQTGWNEKEKTGTFKDGKKLNVKLSPTETAGLIAAIDRNVSLAVVMDNTYVYHDGTDYGLTIVFEPAFKKEKQGEKWVDTNVQRGFKFQVTKTNKANKEDKESFSVGLTYAELSLLKYYLIDTIYHFCGAWKAEDVAAASAKKDKKAPSKDEAAPAQQEKPAEPAASDDNWD